MEKETSLEEIYKKYQQLNRQGDDILFIEYLEYLASEGLYHDLKDEEKYAPLAIELIPYINDPEWLSSFGYNLLNNFSKKEEYQKAAYDCFLSGSQMEPDKEREGYHGDYDKRESIISCKAELGRCLLNGVGVKKDAYHAVEILHEVVGTLCLSFNEYYDIVAKAYKEIENSNSLEEQYRFYKWCYEFDGYDEEDEPVVDKLCAFADSIAKEIYQKAIESKADYSKELWFKELKEEIEFI